MKKNSSFYFLSFLTTLNVVIPFVMYFNESYKWLELEAIGLNSEDVYLTIVIFLNAYILYQLLKLKPKRKKRRTTGDY